MLAMDVNFLGEEEILREIKTIPEQMIKILERLKTSKAPGADEVCPGDEKHENLSRYGHKSYYNRGRMLVALKVVTRNWETGNY